jgi:hypothetical protein
VSGVAELRMGLDRVAFARTAGFDVLLAWQEKALRSNATSILFNAARQSGKSSIAALIAVHTALYQPGSLVLMVSRTLDHSGELFRRALGIYRNAGRPVPADSETKLSLMLGNGSRIVSRPGRDEASVRGYSSDLLILDEASRVPDELFTSSLPVVARTGGRILALSTPFGRRGWFFEEWSSGAQWERYLVPASTLPEDWYRPSTHQFLARESERMSERELRQEYLCEFTELSDSVFHTELIDAAITDEEVPLWLD